MRVENAVAAAARTGSRAAAAEPDFTGRESLVAAHEWVAFAVAAQYGRPHWVEFEDLVQWARVGLVRAAGLFDPGRGHKFSTYAFHWCRSCVRRFLRTERGRGMAVPDDKPCPARTGELVHAAGGGEWDAGAEPADHRPAGCDPALRAWCSEEYRRQRRCLDWRSRVLLYLRTVEGWTLEEIGGQLGVTRERVRQLEAKAVRELAGFRSRERLRKQLEGRGVA